MVSQSQQAGTEGEGRVTLRRSTWIWYFLPAVVIALAVSFVEWVRSRNGFVFVAPGLLIGLWGVFAFITPKVSLRDKRLTLHLILRCLFVSLAVVVVVALAIWLVEGILRGTQ